MNAHGYKIRDKTTGLFWASGKECKSIIGKTFKNTKSMDGYLHGILYPNGVFPEDWEKITVEIVENVIEIRDAAWVRIDQHLATCWQKVSKERGIRPILARNIAIILRELYRSDQINDHLYLCWRGGSFSRVKHHEFVKNMKNIGIDKTHFTRKDQGWILFDDEISALGAKMAGLIEEVFEIKKLLEIYEISK